ncbi:Uncharacterised protein [Vibrio cholerae]|nr:Uncharacterised protein [Vibrio cholerae]
MQYFSGYRDNPETSGASAARSSRFDCGDQQPQCRTDLKP